MMHSIRQSHANLDVNYSTSTPRMAAYSQEMRRYRFDSLSSDEMKSPSDESISTTSISCALDGSDSISPIDAKCLQIKPRNRAPSESFSDALGRWKVSWSGRMEKIRTKRTPKCNEGKFDFMKTWNEVVKPSYKNFLRGKGNITNEQIEEEFRKYWSLPKDTNTFFRS